MTIETAATSVQVSVLVDAPLEHAFKVFTEGMDTWWPREHHLLEGEYRDAVFEPRALDELLPEGEEVQLDSVQLDEAAITEALCRYLSALVYNRAIPVIDERLTRLQNQPLAQQRDRELRDYIDALVRLHMQDASPLGIDWQGPDGRGFVEGILRAVYDQLEEWE